MDQHALTELRLFIENDATLYRQKTVPITANLDRKVKQGKYDSNLAPKAWLHLVDAGALKYVGGSGVGRAANARRTFPTDLRMALAKELAKAYEAEAGERGIEIDPSRHLCGSCARHEESDLARVAEIRRNPDAPESPSSPQAMREAKEYVRARRVGKVGPLGSRPRDTRTINQRFPLSVGTPVRSTLSGFEGRIEQYHTSSGGDDFYMVRLVPGGGLAQMAVRDTKKL